MGNSVSGLKQTCSKVLVTTYLTSRSPTVDDKNAPSGSALVLPRSASVLDRKLQNTVKLLYNLVHNNSKNILYCQVKCLPHETLTSCLNVQKE